MKISELLMEAPGEALKALKAALSGKKLTYGSTQKFVAEHPEWFEVQDGKSHLFTVKKGTGLTPAAACRAIQAVSDMKVYPLSRGTCVIDWPYEKPIAATIVLDQPVFKSENFKNGLDAAEYKKVQSEQYSWAVKHAKKRPSDPAAEGWFVTHSNSSVPAYGRFDEGPMKGDLFAIEHPYYSDGPMKKGDKIHVKADSTYGRVKLVK